MTLFLWQSTASVNAGADPNVNWAEGQPPPTVNNSARAMMAAHAKYRDDFGGARTTAVFSTGGGEEGGGGTSATITATVYTATSSQDFTQPGVGQFLNDHQLITIVLDTDSGDSPTLTLDGFGPFPLLNGSGNAIIESELLTGVPYLFRYKLSDTSFYLENPPADLDQSVPLGAILLYAGTILPSNKFAFCNGLKLNQTDYASLFALIGFTYTTDFSDEHAFQIPDLEGLTIIGQRTGSGAIPLAPVATATGDATVPGTVNGWTIVLPYIMRVI
jgi:hypothetical protein